MNNLVAVLYSHYSHEHGMYPYHYEPLTATVDAGLAFFNTPHENAWVVVGVFESDEEAIRFIDTLEQMRPPKVRIP